MIIDIIIVGLRTASLRRSGWPAGGRPGKKSVSTDAGASKILAKRMSKKPQHLYFYVFFPAGRGGSFMVRSVMTTLAGLGSLLARSGAATANPQTESLDSIVRGGIPRSQTSIINDSRFGDP